MKAMVRGRVTPPTRIHTKSSCTLPHTIHTFCSAAIFPSYSLTSFSKPRSTSSSRVIHLL